MTVRASLLVLLLFPAIPTAAQVFELRGSVAGEQRFFYQEPRDPDPLHPLQSSLILEPDFRFKRGNTDQQIELTPFLRLDLQDSERTHWDLREAFWRGVFGDWEVLVGVNRVFWGVTESRHLVNIINQTDFLEDIDEEDRLGQPMVNIEWQRPWGRLSGYALIGFRERPFPGPDGRLRPPLRVDEGGAVFPDGKRNADFALRYSHFFGDFDLGAYVFHGTNREPSLVLHESAGRLLPLYRSITQVGVDLQYTRNAWLWKLESIVREGEGATFGAFVGGFEYTRYQLAGSAADLGLLCEYLFDGRNETAPVTPFENDLFLGSRLALNDIQDTSLLAGAIVDLKDGSVAARIEAERRLTNHFKLELESRLFAHVGRGNPLELFARDSFLSLRIGYYF